MLVILSVLDSSTVTDTIVYNVPKRIPSVPRKQATLYNSVPRAYFLSGSAKHETIYYI